MLKNLHDLSMKKTYLKYHFLRIRIQKNTKPEHLPQSNQKNDQIYFDYTNDPVFLLTHIHGIESIIIKIEEDDNKTATYGKEKKATSPSEDYIFHFWTYTLPYALYGRGHFCISQIELEIWFINSRQIHVIFGQIVSPLHSIMKSIAEQIIRYWVSTKLIRIEYADDRRYWSDSFRRSVKKNWKQTLYICPTTVKNRVS